MTVDALATGEALKLAADRVAKALRSGHDLETQEAMSQIAAALDHVAVGIVASQKVDAAKRNGLAREALHHATRLLASIDRL